ncbi:MAG: AcrR family transcriptional regulator [Myxococcota bacterium]|jgi:AcrR family transcriptional regulator
MATRRLLNQRRILDGAAHILETGSWGGLTIDSLARYLKMSKSTLYRCFISKDAVVNELVGEICARVDGHYLRIAQDAASPAHVEFEWFVDAYSAFCDELPVLWSRNRVSCLRTHALA